MSKELNELTGKALKLKKENIELKRRKTTRKILLSVKREHKNTTKTCRDIVENKCRIIERKKITIKSLRIKNTRLEKRVSNNFSFTDQLMSSLKQTETETQNKIYDLTTKLDDGNKSLN